MEKLNRLGTVFLAIVVAGQAGFTQQSSDVSLYQNNSNTFNHRIEYKQKFSNDDLRTKKPKWLSLIQFITGISWGKDTNPPLMKPIGLTVDAHKNLYVTDTEAEGVHVISMIDLKKYFISEFKQKKLQSPVDI